MELFCIYLVIVAILAVIYIFVLEKTKEGFKNTFQFESQTINTNDYLFPTKDLQSICQKEGLAPAYGPSDCVKNGEFVPYANCKCKDPKTGICKICYPEIKRDEKSASIIYQANKF
jgi:hypothetical protein